MSHKAGRRQLKRDEFTVYLEPQDVLSLYEELSTTWWKPKGSVEQLLDVLKEHRGEIENG